MDVFVSRLPKYVHAGQSIRIESIRGIGFRFISMAAYLDGLPYLK